MRIYFCCRVMIVFLLFPFAQSYSKVSEEEYGKILDKFETLFKDEILLHTKRPLDLQRKWNGGSILIKDSANQHPSTTTADVLITGQLAQHPKMTPDAFALMVCHEFGHHLGGAPLQKTKLNTWSSVEGQADYWASFHCLRRYFNGDDHKQILKGANLPKDLKERCKQSFPSSKKDQYICQRSIKAALTIGQYLNDTRASNKKRPINYLQPETVIATTTKITYGTDQCRIDTFLAGALCPNQHKPCLSGAPGGRPLCWYAPLKEIAGEKPLIFPRASNCNDNQ